jgi:SMODS-associating 4TM effector domain
VLQLPWNDIKTDKPPDPELIKEQADKYQNAESGLPPLTNWYAPVVSDLPLEVGRVICQRGNCWWDSKQRRCYATCVIASVIIVTILMIGLGFIRGLTVEKLFLVILLPLSPALLLGVRQLSEQTEAANRLDKLKEYAESLWSDMCNGSARTKLANKCRALQDEIFENRKRSPLVFDWIFRKLRNDYDAQMNHGAVELAKEAKQRFGITS